MYRVFRKEAKRTTKILHGLLHVVALIIALVGEFLGAALSSPPAASGSRSWVDSPFPRLLGLAPLSSSGIPGRDGMLAIISWTKAQKFWLAVSPGSPLLSLFHVQPCPHMAPASAPGLVAVFDYHRKKSYSDLYSLHSWCGILVFVLYFVQVSLTPDRGRGG